MPWQVFLYQLPCQRSIFSSGANHWVTPQDLGIATLNSTISFVTSLESQKGPMFSAASACQSHCFPHESEDKAPISQSTLAIPCNLGPTEVPWSSNGKQLFHLLLVPGSGHCPWGRAEGPTSETKLRPSLLTHTYFALSFLQSACANCYQPITNALTHPNSSRDHWGPTRIPQYKDTRPGSSLSRHEYPDDFLLYHNLSKDWGCWPKRGSFQCSHTRQPNSPSAFLESAPYHPHRLQEVTEVTLHFTHRGTLEKTKNKNKRTKTLFSPWSRWCMRNAFVKQ